MISFRTLFDYINPAPAPFIYPPSSSYPQELNTKKDENQPAYGFPIIAEQAIEAPAKPQSSSRHQPPA